MPDVVNLRRARKQQERDAASQAAQENRVRFGRGKAAKANDASARERAAKSVDGARLDDETPRSD